MTSTSPREIALDFLRLAASGQARAAFDKYAAPGFRHHNPYFRGDAESLMNAMDENAKQNPEKTFDAKHVLQDGDLVAVHSWVCQNATDRGSAVVHIFRFEDGRIAELWDVGMAVPETSPNENGMF